MNARYASLRGEMSVLEKEDKRQQAVEGVRAFVGTDTTKLMDSPKKKVHSEIKTLITALYEHLVAEQSSLEKELGHALDERDFWESKFDELAPQEQKLSTLLPCDDADYTRDERAAMSCCA